MNRSIVMIASVGLAGMVAGCGGVSEVTKERVARSASVVEQSQQTVGNSEAGAIEVQRAKNLVRAAQTELNKKNGEAAERLAIQAQLNAELAVAKADSAQARKAADELMASIETLRQEAARSPSN
jgi:hypothetical protein